MPLPSSTWNMCRLPLCPQFPCIISWLSSSFPIRSLWTSWQLFLLSYSILIAPSDVQTSLLSDCLVKFTLCQTRGHTYSSPLGLYYNTVPLSLALSPSLSSLSSWTIAVRHPGQVLPGPEPSPMFSLSVHFNFYLKCLQTRGLNVKSIRPGSSTLNYKGKRYATKLSFCVIWKIPQVSCWWFKTERERWRAKEKVTASSLFKEKAICMLACCDGDISSQFQAISRALTRGVILLSLPPLVKDSRNISTAVHLWPTTVC